MGSNLVSSYILDGNGVKTMPGRLMYPILVHSIIEKKEMVSVNTYVVGLDGNPAIWQHSIVEMLACAWLLCCDSEANKLDI